jgi:NRPS condensation-like uncharacterized protein
MPQSPQAPSAFWKAVKTTVRLQHQAQPIPCVPRNGKLPLSFAQERLWFVEQTHPGSAVHNLRAVFHLKGTLNIPVLQQSLQEIVRRHEILRTTFPGVNGHPNQVIAPDAVIALPVVALNDLPEQQREAEIRRLATAEAQQPFDLAHGPLLRVKLLRLAEDEHVLLRMTHHLINDRWSDSVFMRELGVLYQAFVNGISSPLPDLPIQYADFAHFQRQWLQEEILETQLTYWRNLLSGNLPTIALPCDAPPPIVQTYQGAARYLTIPKLLSDALKTLSQQQEVSLFVIVFAAFNLLLYQYSGQEDLIVCSPVSGRHRVETKKLIGYFSNLVLFRTSLEGNPSFREVLERVSRVAVNVFEHQDMPLQYLAEALHIPGSVLSQVMFALQNVPSRPFEFAGIQVTPLDIEEGIANFDLSLSIKEQGDQLIGVCRYKTDLFTETKITQILTHFQELLESLVLDPQQRLTDLPHFITTAQKRMATVEQAVYVAPQPGLEQTIATVWQEILQLEQISVHANFFELGGRSLQMVRIGQQLQTLLNRDISIKDLFRRPTISGMAQYLSQTRTEKPLPIPPAAERTNRQKDAMLRQKQLMQQRRKRT